MQAVFMTNAAAVLGFVRGLRGTLRVTLEEGTHAAWLHSVLKPQVAEVVVCNPRKNALLKSGNKNDLIDARKLADLFRTNLITRGYYEDSKTQMLKEIRRTDRTATYGSTR